MVDIALAFFNELGLLGVFIVTFLSYSIIPFPSEFSIVAASWFFKSGYVLLFALAGSILGSLSSYYIGYKGIRRFFPKKGSKALGKVEKIVDKYGPLSLFLFGWLPFIGDPLIIIAGSLRMNFWKFLVYSTLARAIYFIIVIWFGVSLGSLF
ncbi:MAG: VTT domain-containing protein [Nanoarchaeota archaeon]